MSSEALNLVRAHRFDSPSRKSLMHFIADYVGRGTWSTFVSQARLARETELGERTVRRLLHDLEREGLIRRERRYSRRRTGGRMQDHIILMPRAISALPVTTLPATVAAKGYRPTATTLAANRDNLAAMAEAARARTVRENLTEHGRSSAPIGSPVRVADILAGLALSAADGR